MSLHLFPRDKKYIYIVVKFVFFFFLYKMKRRIYKKMVHCKQIDYLKPTNKYLGDSPRPPYTFKILFSNTWASFSESLSPFFIVKQIYSKLSSIYDALLRQTKSRLMHPGNFSSEGILHYALNKHFFIQIILKKN